MRFRVLPLLVLPLVIAACGGETPPPAAPPAPSAAPPPAPPPPPATTAAPAPPPPPPEPPVKTFSTPLDAMPSDAKQIVAFDGKALRAHPLFASMIKTLRASPAGNDLGKLEKACGFNPIDVIDSAAAAGDFDHMNIVVAFRGTKSPQEVLGCMAKVDGKEPTMLRGLAAVPLGGPGVAVAAGDVVLIGDRPAVEAALNGGSGKSALSSMVKLDAGVVAAAAGELPEGPVSKFAGVFKASDKDLAVEVTLDTPTPQRAEGLVSIVKKGIAEGPKKGDIASDKKLARDVAELLRSVTVKADGSKVVGRVGVSGDAKKQAAYVALVTRIVETALAKKSGGSTPPAAPPPPPAPKKKLGRVA